MKNIYKFLFFLMLLLMYSFVKASDDSFTIIVDDSINNWNNQVQTFQQPYSFLNSAEKTYEENENYAEKEIFIKFRKEPKVKKTQSPSYKQNSKNSLVVESLENFEFINTKFLKLKNLSVKEAIKLYKDHPSIEYIEPNYRIRLNSSWNQTPVPDDEHYSKLWWIDKIKMRKAWNIEPWNNVLVAVLDTGVDYNHEDLKDNMWTNTWEIAWNGIDDDGNWCVDDIHGCDFTTTTGTGSLYSWNPMDIDGHWTHVTWTIVATGNNWKWVIWVNPNAKILAIKIIWNSSESLIYRAVKGIEYSVKMWVKLSSNSWWFYLPTRDSSNSDILKSAIANAGIIGQIFVGAVWNGWNDNIWNNNDSILVNDYPVDYDLDNIIAVASSTENDELSNFSNYWETSVDISAPWSQTESNSGVVTNSCRSDDDIYSTYIWEEKYAYLCWTSMATPHISWALSLMLSRNPDLSVAEAKQILLDSTDKISSMDWKTVSWGRLNVYKALLSTPTTNTGNTSPTITLSPTIHSKEEWWNWDNTNTWEEWRIPTEDDMVVVEVIFHGHQEGGAYRS